MAANQTRQRMAMLVRQWETSDEPRRAFARRHGLTVSQFDYWKRQLRREGSSSAAVDFAPVHVIETAAPARASACIEVVLGTGAHVVIHDGASVDLVRTVVTALRASC